MWEMFEDEGWNSDLEVGRCGRMEALKVLLTPEVAQKVEALSQAVNPLEWLGYLYGDEGEGEILITEIRVPEQAVTSSSVKVTDESLHEGSIGAIHYHSGGGLFFSGVDRAFVNANHQVSIVYSKSGYKAMARCYAPCGLLVQGEAEVSILHPEPRDLKKFLKEAQKKIRAMKIKKPAQINWSDWEE